MTHYDVLGVEPSATDEEIKQAYQNMMTAFRPVAYPGKEDFVTASYKVLINPDSRLKYNAGLCLSKENCGDKKRLLHMPRMRRRLSISLLLGIIAVFVIAFFFHLVIYHDVFK